MNFVPFDQAPAYEAAGHHDMRMRRLQGMEAGPADTIWIGCSDLLPGGGTTDSASDVEKFYVCIEGRIQVTATQGETRHTIELAALDSCRIAPGESRLLRNITDQPARVLLVMPKRTV
jgi:mannose-6-phosphate isomerase-like protein (cupin superfamily)